MTKKEFFYYELMKVQNEVSMIKYGHPYKSENLEEYITTTAFRKKADQLTMKKLEEEMTTWMNMLNELNEKKAIAAWLETEAGKTYVQERKDKMEALRTTVRGILNDSRKYVSEFVKELLGEQWDVTAFSDDHMEIAIIEKYNENGKPCGLFGHEFEIYFGHDWKLEEGAKEYYRWEMNYGTMGSFNLTEDNNTRAQYLVGMAKFASDTTVVTALRNCLHEMAGRIRKIHEQYYELDKEVKNPVMPK